MDRTTVLAVLARTSLAGTALAAVASAAQSPVVLTLYGDSAGDRFGSAVAGAGDVNADGVPDVVVGAPQDDDGGLSAGSARVVSGVDGSVLYVVHGLAPGELLGTAVAGAGDVNRDGWADVLVGAPGSDVGGEDAGRALVLSGRDGTVLYEYVGARAGARLGQAVSALGHTDGDSYADFAIAAPGDGGGVVGIYSGRTGGLLHAPSGFSAGDEFGHALHGGLDFDGDGVADLAVGAPEEDENGQRSGSVRVISGATGAVLFARYGDNGEWRLGTSVALLPDVDGDGHVDVAAGAPGGPSGTAAARVRVWSGGSGVIRYTIGSTGDRFGLALASADVDGDGVADLVVGAPWTDGPGSNAGALRVYSGTDGALVFALDGAAERDELGTAVGLAGDLDGDGIGEVLVGAPRADHTGSDAGTVCALRVFVDCNGNGVHDGLDAAHGTSADCDADLVPDECALASGADFDCNGNGVLDGCDLATETSPDCNGNGIPDECDVAAGASLDCNADGVPDECQVAPALHVEVSPTLEPFYDSSPQSHAFTGLPVPAGDVTLRFTVNGYFSGSQRYFTVDLDDVEIGELLATDGLNCTTQTPVLLVPRATWLDLVPTGQVTVTMDPSNDVDSFLCSDSSVQVTVEVPVPGPPDCDRDGVPDECQLAAGAVDDNGNGVLDACEFERFCTALPNSTGAPTSIHAAGTASVSANDLVLYATGLPPGQTGLFLYSPDQTQVPLGNGNLCLGDATQGFINRLPAGVSSPAGEMTHALDLTSPPAAESTIFVGSTWSFQCWHRDVPAGGAGFNFSDGLEVHFLP